jgi:D-alanyl-lipoteichoic acid acyltransferase DltB (MBOAT superfamily)
MGFRLMRNFDQPYASRSVSEFWRRWHISLSTWFRDYVYIPLGGSRAALWKVCRNLLIVFAISGLWHGANWTFVVWGLLNGVYVASELMTRNARTRLYEALRLSENNVILTVIQIAITFGLTLIAWAFFRAPTLDGAWYLLLNVGNGVALQSVSDGGFRREDYIIAALSIVILEGMQHAQRRFNLVERLSGQPIWFRWATYQAAAWLILGFGVFDKNAFIYFQF